MHKKICIARQPILDHERNLFAYELLFRTSTENKAFVVDNYVATSRVIVNALNQFGIDSLIGDKIAFINADAEFILNDVILTIPPESFIIEVLEHVQMSERIVQRIKDLKEKGYRFALDDATLDDAFMENFSSLFDLIDVLKLEIAAMSTDTLEKIPQLRKKYNFKLLAEKVETQDEFDVYRNLGCELFQGYFFARPEIKEQQTLDPRSQSIFNLINLLDQDISTNELVSAFEKEPQVSLQLIRYLNSSAQNGLKATVKSIQHALSLLGKGPLKNWLLLIGYSKGNEDFENDPLFELLIERSFVMGALAKLFQNDRRFISESSFVGMLSLIDTVFQMPMPTLLAQFNLDPSVNDALLRGDGILGDFLTLTKALEQRDSQTIEALSKRHHLDMEKVEDIVMHSFLKPPSRN